MAEIIFCQINRKIEGILEVFLDFSVQYDGKLADQMRARELNQCFPKTDREIPRILPAGLQPDC